MLTASLNKTFPSYYYYCILFRSVFGVMSAFCCSFYVCPPNVDNYAKIYDVYIMMMMMIKNK